MFSSDVSDGRATVVPPSDAELINKVVLKERRERRTLRFMRLSGLLLTLLIWEGLVVSGFARELLVGQPTRGVDIGAIEFIHKRIIELRDAGKAVLLVSVELDEILSLSDRIAVMFEGRLIGILDREDVTVEQVGLLMAGSVA